MTVSRTTVPSFKFLSTDTKPTVGMAEIAVGIETDTGLQYWWDGSVWALITEKAVTEVLTGKTLTTPTINGAIFASVNKVFADSPYTATATNYVINIDATSGAFTLNLPTAASVPGKTYVINRTDIILSANVLTIDGSGTETIDGLLTYKLWPSEKLVIVSDGTNWLSIDRPTPGQSGYYFRKGTTGARWYYAGMAGTNGNMAVSTTTPGANILWALPLVVSVVTKFERTLFNVITLVAAQNARMGVYDDNGNCYPNNLIFDTGDISVATTGQKLATITSGLQTFQPGLYWLAWETSATVTLQIKILGGLANDCAVLGYTGSTGNEGGAYGWSVAHTYGALPNPFTAGATLLNAAPAGGTPVPALALQAV